MHDTLKQWIAEIDQEHSLLVSGETSTQAIQNMYTIGFTEELLSEWKRHSVALFIQGLRDVYARKTSGVPMIFYSWYDEQAGQLRVSAVTVAVAEGRLPFGCETIECPLEELVDCLFRGDSGLYSGGRSLVWACRI